MNEAFLFRDQDPKRNRSRVIAYIRECGIESMHRRDPFCSDSSTAFSMPGQRSLHSFIKVLRMTVKPSLDVYMVSIFSLFLWSFAFGAFQQLCVYEWLLLVSRRPDRPLLSIRLCSAASKCIGDDLVSHKSVIHGTETKPTDRSCILIRVLCRTNSSTASNVSQAASTTDMQARDVGAAILEGTTLAL